VRWVVEDLEIIVKYSGILIAAMALAACGQSEKKTTITTEDGKTVTISANGNDAENGTATITTDDGDKVTFGSGPASGKNLPLGIPVYPGAEVKGNITGAGGDGKGGAMVIMTTSDAPDKVAAFYKAEAEKRGMTSKSSETMIGNMASFSAENDKAEKLVATITPGEGGQSQVMLVIETK
jgi:hypothetical protein